MNEITLKLRNKVLDEFKPFADSLVSEGYGKDEIIKAFYAQLKIKTKNYYHKMHGLKRLTDFLNLNDLKPDSKAEVILYDILNKNNIKFKFQYPIGPYRADYLIGKDLILELDGPQHIKSKDDRRDSYMRKMGYRVIRVPLWVLVSCPQALIDEIREAA